MMRLLAPVEPLISRPVARKPKPQRTRRPLRLSAIRNVRAVATYGTAALVSCAALSSVNIIHVTATVSTVAFIAIATAVIVNALWPRKKETLVIKHVERKQRTHVHIIHES